MKYIKKQLNTKKKTISQFKERKNDNVDVMLAKRKMSCGELAEKVGITPANLSILKTNKAKAIRFSTLEKICDVLECKPGDILDYEKDWS